MVRIFKRSEKERQAVYSEYVGDGDTKTFFSICSAQPYGPAVNIKKIECVGHVQKRMGTQLRNLKKSMRGKKLSDGKSISGRGRLTDSDIDQIASFYGNAIRANKNSLIDMRMAIWAIFHHKRATDANPSHDFCPKGETSWCKYQKAVFSNTVDNFHHKHSIPTAIMDCMKDIFKNLSCPKLLTRCLGGKTQNSNESINSLIWRYSPKNSGCGKRIVQTAVNEAVISFNEGNIGRLQTMRKLELYPSRHAIAAAKKADMERVRSAEARCLLNTMEVRRALRRKKLATSEAQCHKEGVTYAAGLF